MIVTLAISQNWEKNKQTNKHWCVTSKAHKSGALPENKALPRAAIRHYYSGNAPVQGLYHAQWPLSYWLHVGHMQRKRQMISSVRRQSIASRCKGTLLINYENSERSLVITNPRVHSSYSCWTKFFKMWDQMEARLFLWDLSLTCRANEVVLLKWFNFNAAVLFWKSGLKKILILLPDVSVICVEKRKRLKWLKENQKNNGRKIDWCNKEYLSKIGRYNNARPSWSYIRCHLPSSSGPQIACEKITRFFLPSYFVGRQWPRAQIFCRNG